MKCCKSDMCAKSGQCCTGDEKPCGDYCCKKSQCNDSEICCGDDSEVCGGTCCPQGTCDKNTNTCCLPEDGKQLVDGHCVDKNCLNECCDDNYETDYVSGEHIYCCPKRDHASGYVNGVCQNCPSGYDKIFVGKHWTRKEPKVLKDSYYCCPTNMIKDTTTTYENHKTSYVITEYKYVACGWFGRQTCLKPIWGKRTETTTETINAKKCDDQVKIP